MESPPKRMTRARAAAKASEPAVKTTRIITAAARAKSSATASTKSTAAKRKTRADENEDEEEEQREVVAARKTRGRPKKAEEPEAEAPVKATRGRATKKAATEPPKDEPAPARATRGRPRKAVAEPKIEEEPAPEPAKKTTRARAGTTSRAANASKPAAKKTVTFQEPDKENIEPTIKAKEPATTSLRGRPARRGGATAARRTRAATKTTAATKKPLSPKKVTQMPVSRDESEDELAGESTPMKPLMKSPIKLPGSINHNRHGYTAPVEDVVESTIVVSNMLNPPDLGMSVIDSPARRLPASPFKETMTSPAKRIGAITLPGSALKPAISAEQGANASPFKTSLLASAAKRPASPIKGLSIGSTLKTQHSQSAMKASLFQSPAKRAFPGMKPLTEPRQRDAASLGSPTMKPLALSTPTPVNMVRPSDKLMMEDQPEDTLGGLDEELFSAPIESLQFPGRLSAVLPRYADPALTKDMSIVEECNEEEIQLAEDIPEAEELVEDAQEPEEEHPELEVEAVEAVDDRMAIDELAGEIEESDEEPASASQTPEQSPVRLQNPVFQLREKDLDPCHDMDSDSEDEMTTAFNAVPATPTPAAHKTPKTNGTSRSQAKTSRVSMSSFAALADQLGSWSAHSPVKNSSPALLAESTEDEALQEETAPLSIEASPVVNNFFEDEMSVRPQAVAEESTAAPNEESNDEDDDDESAVEDPSMDDIMVTDEDVALAHEAHEMSLLEPEQLETVTNSAAFDDFMDDTLSEDSQEYGDENDVPVGPPTTNSYFRGPVTPVRLVMKTFNTTTKVPLKPADNSTPSPIKKRSFSASRVAPKRPSGLTRNATVISYSPMKERTSLAGPQEERASSVPATPPPVTPTKSDLWSSIGTPARTPRRDLNPALLRGAVVFVDVYTSEGADASGIFVELLTQMGAKCMKSWNWNPSSNGESSSSKIGITHVVYKDGGKRTMEKVRESNRVVQCVGVSWVLDCERENKWLDEAPYYIDTKTVPRGGARRRKSMEPKALANLNGTLVSSPVKGSHSQTAPNTPVNRRESSAWMFTPSDQADEDMEDHEWSNIILTPVPKTPAPDVIARYAANIDPETPSVDDDEDDLSPTKDTLLTRTCPPKANPFREMGEGLLSQDKDEQVLMRLMAARRKSLQFAPRIGSPLAKAWK
ncbi:Fc.00g004730.m01.CDS01 [Cosmosporella sp. VM-42]